MSFVADESRLEGGVRERRGYVRPMRVSPVVRRSGKRAWCCVLRAVVAALSLALLTAPAAASSRVVDAIALVASHARGAEARSTTNDATSAPATRSESSLLARCADPVAALDTSSSFLTTRVPAGRGERLYLLDCALLR